MKLRPDPDPAIISLAERAKKRANELFGLTVERSIELQKKISALYTGELTEEIRGLIQKKETCDALNRYYSWYMEGIRDLIYPDRRIHEEMLEIVRTGDKDNGQWLDAIGYHNAYFLNHYELESKMEVMIHGEDATRVKKYSIPQTGLQDIDSFEY